MAYRVAATTLWIPMVQMQLHTTTLDGYLQVQMELLKSCGGFLVDWSLKLSPECVGLDDCVQLWVEIDTSESISNKTMKAPHPM